jgi:16S rRNA (guanine527-N7)-methyltransferase
MPRYAPNLNLRSADAPRRPGMVSAIPAAQKRQFLEQISQDLEALELTLSAAQIAQLLRFLDHLLKWNALMNISAVTEPAQMLTVHIVDSLAALPQLRRLGFEKCDVLDVGTGPGLPAVPWAIAEPNAQIHAIDSVRKKIDTIAEFVANEKLWNLHGEHLRIEDVRAQYDVVTSRAFSSLKNFVNLAGSSVRGGGVMLALKGKAPDDEIGELEGTEWVVSEIVPIAVPRLDAERCVVVLRRR